MFDGTHVTIWNRWKNYILHEFDFSVIGQNTHLVVSIPGIHYSQPLLCDGNTERSTKKYDATMNGLRRLHYLLRSKMAENYFKKSTSRKCSKTSESDGDAIEGISSSISYDWGLHSNLMTALQGHDALNWGKLKLSYLTQEQSHAIVHRSCLSFLHCSQRSYSVGFPLRGCEQNCSRSKCQNQACKPCLMYKYVNNAHQRNVGRSNYVQHTKMLLRASTKEGSTNGYGWIYAGSHNLSSSAWGSGNLTKSTKKEQSEKYKRNRINHYELGILLTNVEIQQYEKVIPWDRHSLNSSTQYDTTKDVPYTQPTIHRH
jgi:hypothetical protein